MIDKIKNLKRGEIIICQLKDGTWKQVKYSMLQKESLESLFRSLKETHNAVEIKDSELMSKFLDEYFKVFATHEVLCERVLKGHVGKEVFLYMKQNRIRWEIDTDLNILKIYS